MARKSSKNLDYETGQLSLFPTDLDTKDQLYRATNNSQTILSQSLTYNGKYIVVENNDNFPNSGILRVGAPAGDSGAAEMIYYGNKTRGIFRDVIRGFAGSRQNIWPVGSYVANAVFAEHHNSVKDAIINIEKNLGTSSLPEGTSLNGILKKQETRFLSPKAIFRASIVRGAPPLKVRFQNFSTGSIVRSLWDFGDGTTSIERSPIHTYRKEGIYTVNLNIITSLGAQGYAIKSNYITVDDEERKAFFYVDKVIGVSKETADSTGEKPTVFNFIDQTDGDIIKRWWILNGDAKEVDENGDEITSTENQTIFTLDPNKHSIKVVYDKPGEYNPSLLVLLSSQTLKKAFINPNNTIGLGIKIL